MTLNLDKETLLKRIEWKVLSYADCDRRWKSDRDVIETALSVDVGNLVLISPVNLEKLGDVNEVTYGLYKNAEWKMAGINAVVSWALKNRDYSLDWTRYWTDQELLSFIVIFGGSDTAMLMLENVLSKKHKLFTDDKYIENIKYELSLRESHDYQEFYDMVRQHSQFVLK